MVRSRPPSYPRACLFPTAISLRRSTCRPWWWSRHLDVAGVYARLNTRPEGLTTEEAATRLAQHGPIAEPDVGSVTPLLISRWDGAVMGEAPEALHRGDRALAVVVSGLNSILAAEVGCHGTQDRRTAS